MDQFLNQIQQPLLGEWYVDSYIGSGRYGRVYKAHNNSGRIAAIKVISLPNEEMRKEFYFESQEELANHVFDITQEFANEIEVMRIIGQNCPNVIQMYDHIAKQHDDGISWDIYIVMEYATVLKESIMNNGLTVYDVLKMGTDITNALIQCDKNNIIHRDIKEDNLFLGSDGNYKIGDFGVAKISSATQGKMTVGIGTPYYMAPEVLGMRDYDKTVDIYSLGMVLYKLFNYDRLPFMPRSTEKEQITRGEHEEANRRRLSGDRMEPPEFADDQTARIILKCCEFNPAYRYHSAEELMNDLKLLMNTMSHEEMSRPVRLPIRKRQKQARPMPPVTPVSDPAPIPTPPVSDEPVTVWEREDNDGTQTEKIFHGGINNNNDIPPTNGGYGQIPNQQVYNTDYDQGNTTVPGFSTVSMIKMIAERMRNGKNNTSGPYSNDDLSRMVEEKIREKEVKRQEAERKAVIHARKSQSKNVIISIVAAIALIAACFGVFSILNSTSYTISDNHNKYIFSHSILGGDKLFAEIPVSYLRQDGGNLYYSRIDKDHSLYRMNIRTKEETLMCADDCEYDIVIDDYIYFTSYEEGSVLYRMKKDGSADEGTEKELLLDSECYDLDSDGKTLLLKVRDLGSDVIKINTKTLDKDNILGDSETE